MGRFVAGKCDAVGFVAYECYKNLFVIAAMSIRLILIICLASTCSYVGQRALYIEMKALCWPRFFNRVNCLDALYFYGDYRIGEAVLGGC